MRPPRQRIYLPSRRILCDPYIAYRKTIPTGMHIYPKRACLEGLEIEIFKLVSYCATPEQWKAWLRVPLEHAAARGNLDCFNRLLAAGANVSAGWRGCRDRTLLDAAAVGGNEEVVSGLLRVGAQPDVNVVSCSSKRSALYTAAVLGHEAVARRLIVAGADVNVLDPVLSSVLHEATRGGHEQLVTDLLIAGANPNWQDGRDRTSALHWAASEGCDGIVSTLLLRGADKDALDNHGETPLIWASFGGNFSVVKTLLAAGADASIRDTSHDCSALDIAAREGHGDVVEAIVEAIVERGADVNAVRSSVLYEATWGGHEQLVTDLLIAGANPNWRDGRYGTSALDLAAEYGYDRMVSTLLLRGADKDALDDDGKTPLMWASFEFGGLSVVKTLLAAGADASIRDIYGASALHFAARNGHGDVVEALVEHGTDVNVVDQNQFTPLHGAARHNDTKAVDVLLRAGANIEARCWSGTTPLYWACEATSREAVLSLLKHGADVNTQGHTLQRPLFIAALNIGGRQGAVEIVDHLLRAGADETIADNRGNKPADAVGLEKRMYRLEGDLWVEDENRAHELLANAPADRAWRRRGWLVMLRSRDSKAKAGKCCSNGHGAGTKDEGSETAKREDIEDVEYDPRKTNNGVDGELETEAVGGVIDRAAGLIGLETDGAMGTANNDGSVVGAEGGQEGLRLEVLLLLGLGLEGVFRTVVGFL